MPFFTRRDEVEEPVPEPVHEEEPRKRGFLGSLRRDPSPTPTTSTQSTRRSTSTFHTTASSRDGNLNNGNGSVNGNGSGMFHRGSRHGSILHKFGGSGGDHELDPSIVQARERVMGAEAAEMKADRALELARREVHDAREEVKRLEIEAKEEARRAKIKQYHAKDISKRGKALGRKLFPYFFGIVHFEF